MSAIIVPNVGEKEVLRQLKGDWNDNTPVRVKLFRNNFDPGEDTVFADFTEPTNAGYGQQDLNNWGIVELTPDAEAYVIHPEVTFTATGGSPVTCYGYFVINGDDLSLMFCQKFDNPRTFGPANPVTFGIIFKLRQIPIP